MTITALKRKYAKQIRETGKYVKVVRRAKEWQVGVEVGNQGFFIEPRYDVRREAEWMRIMLCNALYRLKHGDELK